MTNILVYGNVPYKTLNTLNKNDKIFICDTPKKLSLKTVKEIIKDGRECTYLQLNSLPYIMSEISEVWVGSDCVMSNGDVLAPVGTSLVCLVAHTYGKPVTVYASLFSQNFTKNVSFFEYTPKNKKYKRSITNYDITPSKYLTKIIKMI
jgi:translation initiation factor 2B subunit (eIF-2B alpha/beta/delta family)